MIEVSMSKHNSVLSYDDSDEISIYRYAKKLEGQTFQDVIDNAITREDFKKGAHSGLGYGDFRRKGGLGNLLEELYFGYKANSESAPDFPKAGVELKTTPYEITRKGEYRAGERLVLSMIDYSSPINSSFYDSHVWNKCRRLLLICYWRNREIQDNLKYPIGFVALFTPSETDLAIIENDYSIIVSKIQSGKADELSESDTFYLGACTKGATAESSIVKQYYPPYTPAKKRAFCYKNSYMTFVLKNYVVNVNEVFEPIIKSKNELKEKSFEAIVTEKINRYRGISDKELCLLFNREYNNNKAQWTDITYRMLGIKSNRAEEFRKANVVVKVIRLESNGKMKESMSFPPFQYKEIIKESWEESTLHNYFDETKFLFVVFKKDSSQYVLKGCQFWNMPFDDLNMIVKNGWNRVVETIKNGVTFNIVNTKSGIVVENNLPKKKDNLIIHVRPHAQKRFFEFLDGTIIGDGNKSQANQLPDGTWMTNYSFWINNEYVISQLNNDLK